MRVDWKEARSFCGILIGLGQRPNTTFKRWNEHEFPDGPLYDVSRRVRRLLESTPEKIADEIPEGFNNNIRWHGGHILTVADAFFGLGSIPGEYQALFGPGSKPGNWPGEVPSLSNLAFPVAGARKSGEREDRAKAS